METWTNWKSLHKIQVETREKTCLIQQKKTNFVLIWRGSLALRIPPLVTSTCSLVSFPGNFWNNREHTEVKYKIWNSLKLVRVRNLCSLIVENEMRRQTDEVRRWKLKLSRGKFSRVTKTLWRDRVAEQLCENYHFNISTSFYHLTRVMETFHFSLSSFQMICCLVFVTNMKVDFNLFRLMSLLFEVQIH